MSDVRFQRDARTASQWKRTLDSAARRGTPGPREGIGSELEITHGPLDQALQDDWAAQAHRNAQIACAKFGWVQRGSAAGGPLRVPTH